MKNIIIIGGGIIGLSSAYYLSRDGHRVTVLDKGDFLDNCSYGNAGYVCPSHFVPLAAPGIIKQGLRWMLDPQSPFYVKPALNWSLIDWGFRFMKSASKRNVQNAAMPLRDIALLSQEQYAGWARLPGFDFSYEHKGLLEIFQTQKMADHAVHTVHAAKELGLEVELLDKAAMQAKEPQTPINAMGAIFFKCDAHLYPNRLMTNLISHLKTAGVSFEAGQEVIRFEKKANRISKVITSSRSFDEVDEAVLASGSWSRGLAAQLQLKIPLVAGRGYSITLEDSPYQLNYPAILTEGRVAITPMDGNKIRFGGTMEVVTTDTPPRFNRVNGILRAVKGFIPSFDVPRPADNKIWYGYRPCSADGVPYIGRSTRTPNLVVATGHAMLGLSLGAGTGLLVKELVNGEKPSIDLRAFDAERFH